MYLSFMRTKVRFDVAFLNVIFGLKYVFGSWPSGQSLSVRTNIQNVSSALFQGGRSCPASVDCKRIPQRLHIANYDCMKTLVHVKYTLVEAGFFEVYSFILQKTLGENCSFDEHLPTVLSSIFPCAPGVAFPNFSSMESCSFPHSPARHTPSTSSSRPPFSC